MSLSYDQLLRALNAAVRGADQGGNTSAADLRGFLTTLLGHLEAERTAVETQLSQAAMLDANRQLPADLLPLRLAQQAGDSPTAVLSQQAASELLAQKEPAGVAAGLVATGQQAAAIVYRAGAVPLYTTPAALGLHSPTAAPTAAHDLLVLRNSLAAPLYLTSQDYTVAAHEAVLNTVVLGGSGASRRIRLAGGRVAGVLQLGPAGSGDGHDVHVTQAAYLEALAFSGSGAAPLNRYTFTGCTIGRISQAPTQSSQQVIISHSVLGGVPDQPVIAGGTAATNLTLSNCVLVLRGTATVLGGAPAGFTPIYRNVLVVAADGSTSLLGAPAAGVAAAQLTDASPAGRDWLRAPGPGAWKQLLALTKADLGLGLADNTADRDKPVSGPVAAYVAAATQGLAPAFVPIGQNQYGQHPAFGSQSEVNAWLLAQPAVSGSAAGASYSPYPAGTHGGSAPGTVIGIYGGGDGYAGINPDLLATYPGQRTPAVASVSPASGRTGEVITVYGRNLATGLVAYVGGTHHSPSGNSTELFGANEAGTVAYFRVPVRPDFYPPTEGDVLIASLLLRAPGGYDTYASDIRFTWLRA